MPKAIVCECDDSIFTGDITISGGCIIHPRVTIIAKSGPIIIGENCLIEEYTTIIYDTGNDTVDTEDGKSPILVIGANNIFEVGCQVEATKIGEKNIFESKCHVSRDVKVTNNCIIGAGCQLVGAQTLPENTIIHGRNCAEREAIERSSVRIRTKRNQSFLSNHSLFFENYTKICPIPIPFWLQSHQLQLAFLRKLLPNYHMFRKPTFDPKKLKGQVW